MGINSMGSGRSNKTFFNIYGGSLVIEYDKEEDLIKKLESLGQRVDKIKERKRTKGKNEGKAVYYHILDDIGGNLVDAGIADTDFGENLFLEFEDISCVFRVSLGNVFGRHGKDFIRRAENLDLNKAIILGTWSMENDDGKTYSGVKMYQDGKKVEYVYDTKDLPPGVTKKRGNKSEWDYSEQENFLYGILKKFLKDNFKPKVDTPVKGYTAKKEKAVSKPSKTANKPAAKAVVEEKKDLPWE